MSLIRAFEFPSPKTESYVGPAYVDELNILFEKITTS